MATLRAHGRELYRLRAAGYDKVYMEDGTVLKNSGDGWKVYARCRNNPADLAEKVREKHLRKREEQPAYREFLDRMLEVGGIRVRSALCMYISLMPNDPDGVWSEMDSWRETRDRLSHREISELCRLYNAAIAEQTG